MLETLIKRDKPKLHGVVKPESENKGDYCRVSVKDRFAELLNNINARYLVVFYNNTYDSKSNSFQNKITLKDVDFGDKLWQNRYAVCPNRLDNLRNRGIINQVCRVDSLPCIQLTY